MMQQGVLFFIRLIIAIVLIQTLFFKFTAHPDSVYIFTTVGMEPFGRIGIGVMELIAAILLMFRKTIWLGAGLATGILSGAIIMHFTQLGIEVQGDGGMLFFMAIGTFLISFVVLFFHRKEIPIIGLKL